MTNDRWLAACHEAGHAVAGIVLGGRCEGAVLVVDGGLAYCDGLSPDNEAFMTASGPAAEHLAAEFDPPAGKPATYEQIASTAKKLPKETSRNFALSCCFADVPDHSPPHSKSDDRLIAEWAIGGIESEPDRWESRVNLARYIAGKIVADHSPAIVRVARRLFTDGRVTGSEIKQLMIEEKTDAA